MGACRIYLLPTLNFYSLFRGSFLFPHRAPKKYPIKKLQNKKTHYLCTKQTVPVWPSATENNRESGENPEQYLLL